MKLNPLPFGTAYLICQAHESTVERTQALALAQIFRRSRIPADVLHYPLHRDFYQVVTGQTREQLRTLTQQSTQMEKEKKLLTQAIQAHKIPVFNTRSLDELDRQIKATSDQYRRLLSNNVSIVM
jgi:hypothetical protein